jgi:hypothetical protein
VANVIDEILQDLFASRCVRDFGMKLEAVKFTLRILDRCEIATFGCSDDAKAFRQHRYFVAVAIPNVELIAQSIEEFRSLGHVQHAGAILTSPGKNDTAVKMMRHQHQPVTNSQYWNA